MKEIFIDLIKLKHKYVGGFVKWKHDEVPRGRKQAVIRPMSTGLRPALKIRSKQVVEYALSDDDVIEKETGPIRWILAVPNTDIPNVHVESTFFHEKIVSGVQGAAARWEEKYKEMRRGRNKWKKKAERLMDEDAEQEKGESQADENWYECDSCEKKSTESAWQENNGLCPQCEDGEAKSE
jgi:hypothetical protein